MPDDVAIGRKLGLNTSMNPGPISATSMRPAAHKSAADPGTHPAGFARYLSDPRPTGGYTSRFRATSRPAQRDESPVFPINFLASAGHGHMRTLMVAPIITVPPNHPALRGAQGRR